MKLRYEIDPHGYALRVYSDRSDIDYIASCVVQTCGSDAWVTNVSSPLVFDAVLDNLEDIMVTLGVERLLGTMNPAMARALRMKVRGRAKFTQEAPQLYAGRMLPWVSISRLEER